MNLFLKMVMVICSILLFLFVGAILAICMAAAVMEAVGGDNEQTGGD